MSGGFWGGGGGARGDKLKNLPVQEITVEFAYSS